MRISGIRKTLKTGAVVFGGSSLVLVFLPNLFLQLLALEETGALSWSMRMIGITVFALSGNMWQNAKQTDEVRVRNTGVVMALAACLLGTVTLTIPAEITLFTMAYAAIGFGFSLAYLINLLTKGKKS